jgi:hypothetical protein
MPTSANCWTLDKEKEVDAVKIMTPDHLHSVISIACMKRGKHVIMHKPIANRLQEAKLVIDTARETLVATHFMPWDVNGSMDQVMAWINTGAIDALREIHSWTRRPLWPQYTNLPSVTSSVPEGFDWDLWLGLEAERPYSPDYTHMLFRGWYHFGGGSMADMGHYSLWTVFNALELGSPISCPESSRFDQSSALHPPTSVQKHRRCHNGWSPSAHSNCISVRRRSGFLQVAVSQVPTSATIGVPQSAMWALQIQPKDFGGVICSRCADC